METNLLLKVQYNKENLIRRFAEIPSSVFPGVWPLLAPLGFSMEPIIAPTATPVPLLSLDQMRLGTGSTPFQPQKSRVVPDLASKTTPHGPPWLKAQGRFCQGHPQLQRPCPPQGRPRSWAGGNGRQPRTEGTARIFLFNDQWPRGSRDSLSS